MGHTIVGNQRDGDAAGGVVDVRSVDEVLQAPVCGLGIEVYVEHQWVAQEPRLGKQLHSGGKKREGHRGGYTGCTPGVPQCPVCGLRIQGVMSNTRG